MTTGPLLLDWRHPRHYDTAMERPCRLCKMPTDERGADGPVTCNCPCDYCRTRANDIALLDSAFTQQLKPGDIIAADAGRLYQYRGPGDWQRYFANGSRT